MREARASRTAVLVCQARAVADGRLAVSRFADPIAHKLLREDELTGVEIARGLQPKRLSGRLTFDFLTATAAILVARTVAIDDALRAQGNDQLVILGAGLDARAYRMAELAKVSVFEVDQPASQADKKARAGGLVPRSARLEFVSVEFGRDPLAEALTSAGFDRQVPTTWIWEGVLPYLTLAQAEATLATASHLSAAGSRLISTYSSRLLIGSTGRVALRVMFALARQSSPMAREPHKSAWSPEEMGQLLTRHGFLVTSDRDLGTVAHELGVTRKPGRHLEHNRVVVADKA